MGKLWPKASLSSRLPRSHHLRSIHRRQRLDPEGQLARVLQEATRPPATSEDLHPQPVLTLEQALDRAAGAVAPQCQVLVTSWSFSRQRRVSTTTRSAAGKPMMTWMLPMGTI